MKTKPDEEWQIVSCYSWLNAIEDGTFVEVTDVARPLGYDAPTRVSITYSGIHSWIKKTLGVCDDELASDEQKAAAYTTGVRAVLLALAIAMAANPKENDLWTFEVTLPFDERPSTQDVWAGLEAAGPNDPTPVISIYLPEER